MWTDAPQILRGIFFLFMELIFQQAQINGDTRTEYMDGREYLVAPAVIIVEGVLNGSYVPAGEIEISTYSWNGRPIPVHHPPIGNSANEPAIIETQVIGSFFGAQYKNNGLVGEMWFDVAKANKLGGDAAATIEAVANGEMIELSTAYWSWQLQQSGEFNGKGYESITSHILPDHVAVLPGDVGACSINDGCGVPRLNHEEKRMNYFIMVGGQKMELQLHDFGERKPQCHRTNVEGMSFRDVGKALKAAVDMVTEIATNHWIWIEDVYDDYFVYEIEVDGESNLEGLWRRDYTVAANFEVTLGEASRVVRRTVYEADPQSPQMQMPQNNTWNKITQFVNNLFDKHVKEMDMKDMIDAIVKDGTTGLTANQLESFSEEAVTAVFNGLHLNEDEGENPEVEADVEPIAPAEPVAPSQEVVPDWAKSLIAKVDGLTATANQAVEHEKAELVAQLTANEQCPFDEADLKEFKLAQLKKLAVSYIEPDYSGLMIGNGADNYDGYEYVGLALNAVDAEVK